MKISYKAFNKLILLTKTEKYIDSTKYYSYSHPIGFNAWLNEDGKWQWQASNYAAGKQYNTPEDLIISVLKDEQGWIFF